MVRGRFSLCVEKITTLIGAISVPYIKPLANADAGSPTDIERSDYAARPQGSSDATCLMVLPARIIKKRGYVCIIYGFRQFTIL